MLGWLGVALTNRLKIFTRATSPGGVESLIEHRQSIEGPTTRAPANLLRVSVELQHPHDLKGDLGWALGLGRRPGALPIRSASGLAARA